MFRAGSTPTHTDKKKEFCVVQVFFQNNENAKMRASFNGFEIRSGVKNVKKKREMANEVNLDFSLENDEYV